MKQASEVLPGLSDLGATAAVELEPIDKVGASEADIVAYGRKIGAVVDVGGAELIIIQSVGKTTSDQQAHTVADLTKTLYKT